MSLVGGLLIGLSATIYILGVGRIAGIAGIVGGALQALIRGSLRGQGVRLAFLLGMVVAPAAWTLFAPLPPMTSAAGTGTLLAASLLVGIGVRISNGCSSGRGRDEDCSPPPAQIRTCGTTAYGSCLES